MVLCLCRLSRTLTGCGEGWAGRTFLSRNKGDFETLGYDPQL